MTMTKRKRSSGLLLLLLQVLLLVLVVPVVVASNAEESVVAGSLRATHSNGQHHLLKKSDAQIERERQKKAEAEEKKKQEEQKAKELLEQAQKEQEQSAVADDSDKDKDKKKQEEEQQPPKKEEEQPKEKEEEKKVEEQPKEEEKKEEEKKGETNGEQEPSKSEETGEKEKEPSEKSGESGESDSDTNPKEEQPNDNDNTQDQPKEEAAVEEPQPSPSVLPASLEGSAGESFIPAVTLNMTAMSLTACEQIEMAVAFLTSLDFDQDFRSNFTNKVADVIKSSTSTSNSNSKDSPNKRAMWDVYLLQIIVTPLSLAMGFFGSNLLLPTCCLCAAGLGVFMVFHFLNELGKSSSRYAFFFQLDCSMKLALGVISAFISATLANFFVRFGLFCLGALAAGGGAYLVLDAFPFLDPTRAEHQDAAAALAAIIDNANASNASASYHAAVSALHDHTGASSELTAFGWVVTTVMGIWGGLFLRWYEQASLEVVTAIMGGVGFAYSLHTLVVVQGGQLSRSIVFLLANFMSFFGWRFQRGRRLWRDQYAHKKNEQIMTPQSPTTAYAALPTTPQPIVVPQVPANWDQLQNTLNSMQGLLQRNNQQQQQQAPPVAAPSAEQVVELTKSLQSLIQRMNVPADDKHDNADNNLNKNAVSKAPAANDPKKK